MIFDVIPLKYPTHFPIGIKGRINLWRNRRALSGYDKIITISNAAKKDIVNLLKISEEKIVVVYPTLGKIFTTSPEKKPKKYPPESKFCIYVGDVNWNKNLVNLARAIKLIDIPCIFVGKPFSELAKGKNTSLLNHPWQQEFKQFLDEVGDDRRFIFRGYTSDQELADLYRQAVCNLLISRDEGFGFSYIEAASQHCPSVLSDTSIFHEIAGKTALYSLVDDPKGIASNIKKLSSDRKERQKLGEMAFNRVTDQFSPGLFTEKILAALTEKK